MKKGFQVAPQEKLVERAYLVGVSLPDSSIAKEREHLDELAALATTAGAVVVGSTIQSRRRIDATTFVGPGKVARIKEECERLAANLVVFDSDLSPAQSRNLEKVLGRQRHRPHGAHPRHFRASRKKPAGEDPGGARPARLHAPAAYAVVGSPLAPGRAGSARAAPARRSSKSTAGAFASGSPISRGSSRNSAGGGRSFADRETDSPSWPSWDTRTRGSRP